MFYFRYRLYKLVKPFLKPIEPDKAIKYHFTSLFLYVFFSSNCALFGWYYYKKYSVHAIDDDEEDVTSTMSACKFVLSKSHLHFVIV